MDDLPETSVHLLWREYKLPLFLGVISCFFIILSLVLIVRSAYSDAPIRYTHADGTEIENSSTQSSQSAILGTNTGKSGQVFIDIEGAVIHPGVIAVPSGSRIEDGINAAGGFTKNADAAYIAQQINRAMKIADGMKIYIPTINETSHINDCATSGNKDVAQSRGIVTMPGKSSQNAANVSVNMASMEQLDTLAGVGPVTAQKIIDNRPYQTLEELVSKKAVGQAVFTKIRSSLSL